MFEAAMYDFEKFQQELNVADQRQEIISERFDALLSLGQECTAQGFPKHAESIFLYLLSRLDILETEVGEGFAIKYAQS